MFREYDVIWLKREIPSKKLPAGAMGTILQIYEQPSLPPAYEVEFTDGEGNTLALITLQEGEMILKSARKHHGKQKESSTKDSAIRNFFLSYPSINFLIIGAGIFVLGLIVEGKIDNPSIVLNSFTFIACLFFITGGVFVIIRKEAPRPGATSLKGFAAIISGLAVIMTSGFAALVLFLSIVDYFKVK
jgi:hypothetical protein